MSKEEFFNIVAVLIVLHLVVSLLVWLLLSFIARKGLLSKRKACVISVIWLTLPLTIKAVGLILNLLVPPSLIEDQVLIDHFYEHKEELNILVDEYRSGRLARDAGSFKWATPEIKNIKHQAKVDKVYSTRLINWHEAPYSMESAIEWKRKIDTKEVNVFTDRSTHALAVRLSLPKVKASINGVPVYKGYLHIPVEPKLENNRLIYPLTIRNSTLGQGYLPVFSNLDSNFNFEGVKNCMVRKITPQWFLYQCKTY